jgi:hypothetical protein
MEHPVNEPEMQHGRRNNTTLQKQRSSQLLYTWPWLRRH